MKDLVLLEAIELIDWLMGLFIEWPSLYVGTKGHSKHLKWERKPALSLVQTTQQMLAQQMLAISVKDPTFWPMCAHNKCWVDIWNFKYTCVIPFTYVYVALMQSRADNAREKDSFSALAELDPKLHPDCRVAFGSFKNVFVVFSRRKTWYRLHDWR